MKLKSFTESKTYIKTYESVNFKKYVLIKLDVSLDRIPPYYILHVISNDNKSVTYDKYSLYHYVDDLELKTHYCKFDSSTMSLKDFTIINQSDILEECKEYLDLILKTEKYNL